jgi:acetyltransferase-like isoleucine patch superfamily enzyme
LHCADNAFSGSRVIIDLSSIITIEANSTKATGCFLFSHEDMSKFNANKSSKLYQKKYLPILIKENVFIGCGITVLAGTTANSLTIVGAKLLISGNISGKILIVGIPVKVKYFNL